MELGLNYLSWLIIVAGALIGSIKANLNDKKPVSNCTRAFNILLGLFCGVMLAGEYSDNLTYWLNGMLAMVGGMVGGTILDVVSELAPNIAKKLINKHFK